MSDTKDFLKFLINEEIYLIDENQNRTSELSDPVESEDPKAEVAPAIATDNSETPVSQAKNEILVLFDNPSSEDIPISESDYLGKILGAIERSIDHVDFFNVAFGAPDHTGYKYVIAFTPNHQLPLAPGAQQYTALEIGETSVITGDSLTNISASTELRKKLWGVLQKVFK